MRTGIVDDGAQPMLHMLERRDDVGLVEVVREEIEGERIVGDNLLEKIHDQIVSLESSHS